MATLFCNSSSNQTKKSKDNYNVFHSQLQICVKCAFGILVQSLAILHSSMANILSIKRIIWKETALTKSHNYFVNQSGSSDEMLQSLDGDSIAMMNTHDAYFEMAFNNEMTLLYPSNSWIFDIIVSNSWKESWKQTVPQFNKMNSNGL